MTIHPWKDEYGNLGTGIPEMKGPDNVVDDSLTVFTLPLPCALRDFPSENVLRALAPWAAGGGAAEWAEPQVSKLTWLQGTETSARAQ